MATNLLMENFARDRVKHRMLRRAADLWGYAESDLDSFDPLVALLIEACAVEFERVSVEIGNTESRLLNRLAQLLHPEPDVARPAFGVAQARPVEPRSNVSSSTQLFHKRAGTSRNDSPSTSGGGEVYFSPIGTHTLVDGSVQFIATTDTLFRVDEANQKTPVAQRQSGRAVLPYQSLWLGLDLDESIESLEGVSFYVDWTGEAGPSTLPAIMAQSHWKLAGNDMAVRSGLSGSHSQNGPLSLEREFDVMHKVEQLALAATEHQFVTVMSSPDLQSLRTQRQAYPAAIGHWFSERDLRALREPLWWIEIQLPYTISQSALEGLTVGINCFPVLNRRLHRITYRLQQNLNIIPLETDRCFLAVRDVRTTQNRPLVSIPLRSLHDLETETYTVQYGVSRFDDRDARQALINLQDLLRDEIASFAALGEDFLSSVIRELNQSLARLEAKVDQKTLRRDSVPYLISKAKQPGDTIFIEYWTCDGETANRLPAGTKLAPYADTSLRRDTSFLVKATQGGRERLKESEKITAYKRSLLSRNRIVTPEDVRAFCLAELGTHLEDVQVERAFRVSTNPAGGFERCIRVSLHPSTASTYGEADWSQQTKLLQHRLETHSISALPYQLLVLPAA